MTTKLMLDNFWGGLGDWLSVTTLAEEFTKQKNCEVFLSKTATFRNEGIRELILRNPYLKGIAPTTYQLIGDNPSANRVYKNHGLGHIQNIEFEHGLVPTNKYPKIYLDPDTLDWYRPIDSTYCLVDLTSITESYNKEKALGIVRALGNKTKCSQLLSLTFDSSKINNKAADKFHGGRHLIYSDVSVGEPYQINGLVDYIKHLIFARCWIGFHSGGHTLATAVKNQFNGALEIYCLINQAAYTKAKETQLFLFDNVNEYIAI